MDTFFFTFSRLSFCFQHFPHHFYTEYAGCAVMAGIPMNFGTAHWQIGPEVVSAKCIDVYGRKEVTLVRLQLTTLLYVSPLSSGWILIGCWAARDVP